MYRPCISCVIMRLDQFMWYGVCLMIFYSDIYYNFPVTYLLVFHLQNSMKTILRWYWLKGTFCLFCQKSFSIRQYHDSSFSALVLGFWHGLILSIRFFRYHVSQTLHTGELQTALAKPLKISMISNICYEQFKHSDNIVYYYFSCVNSMNYI